VRTLEKIGTGSDFLNRTPIAQEIRARIDKWDCVILKSFCTSKETMNEETTHRIGENLC
jgi:hypothetical protein